MTGLSQKQQARTPVFHSIVAANGERRTANEHEHEHEHEHERDCVPNPKLSTPRMDKGG